MDSEALEFCIERQKKEFQKLFPQLSHSRQNAGPSISFVKIDRKDESSCLNTYKRTTRKIVQYSKISSFENEKLQSAVSKATTIYRSLDGGHLVKLEQICTKNLNDDEYEDFDEVVSRKDVPCRNSLSRTNDGIIEYSNESPHQDTHFLQETKSTLDINLNNDHETVFLRLDSVKVGTVEEIKSTKLDKAWLSAKELVDTERKYVSKLHLLHQIYRNRVADLLTQSEIKKLLANLESLFEFHNDHLLPCLETHLDSWANDHIIGNVMLKFSPYLKMYSIYVNNYGTAMSLFEEMKQKNKPFAAIVQEIQGMPECENLPIDAHMICPVQRVPRYQLLLQQYLDNLPIDHVDRKNTELALEKVKESACHANDFMKRLEKYRAVIEIQELVGHQVQGLVTPSRQLIKKGALIKVSRLTGEMHERLVFLFNDLLMICAESRILKKPKLKALLAMDTLRIMDGDNLILDDTFYLVTPDKIFEIKASNAKEKNEWTSAFASTMLDLTSAPQMHCGRDIVLFNSDNSLPKIVMDGFLEIRSGFKSSFWSKRYFVLFDDALLKSFCDKTNFADSGSSYGSLLLIGCSIESKNKEYNHENSRPTDNVIKINHPNKIYYCRCDTQEETVRWIAAFQLCCQET